MIMKRIREAQGEEGFTLTELMVFIGIMVIFLIGVGGMITSGVKSSTVSYNLVKISEGANEALSTMVRQIRVASSLDAACTSSVLMFVGDVDGDGLETTVRFDVSGGYLRRGTGAASMDNWIPNVDAITFTYYWFDPATKQPTPLSSGDWAAHYNEVYRVDMEMTMSIDAVGSDVSRTCSGSVTIRNLLK
jgi:type II secretory pathway pseudopilin PulG